MLYKKKTEQTTQSKRGGVMRRLVKKLYAETVGYVTKNGLPICDILIYLALGSLIIKTEPIWGTVVVISIVGFVYFSWWVTNNENSPPD